MKRKATKKTGVVARFKGLFKKESISDQRQFSALGKLGGKLVIMRATGTLLWENKRASLPSLRARKMDCE